MKQIILLLFFLLSFSVNAHRRYPNNVDSTRIAHLHYDPTTDSDVVPDDLLSGKYDYMFGYFGYVHVNDSLRKIGNNLEFYWSYTYFDWRYHLLFTPKQMVLYSSTETPNSCYVAWISNITETQFNRLKQEYKSMNKKLLNRKYDKESGLHLYVALKALLKQINAHMGDLKFDIPSKKQFNSVHVVQLNPDFD